MWQSAVCIPVISEIILHCRQQADELTRCTTNKYPVWKGKNGLQGRILAFIKASLQHSGNEE